MTEFDFGAIMHEIKDPAFWVLFVIGALVLIWIHRAVGRAMDRMWPNRRSTTVDRLNEAILRESSGAALAIWRNTYAGAAAVCLVILLGVLQIGVTDKPLETAVYAAVIGMPLVLCAASFYEMVISLGSTAREWLLGPVGRALPVIPLLVGGGALLTAIGAVCDHFSRSVMYTFAVASAIALGYGMIGYVAFGRWYTKTIRHNAWRPLP